MSSITIKFPFRDENENFKQFDILTLPLDSEAVFKSKWPKLFKAIEKDFTEAEDKKRFQLEVVRYSNPKISADDVENFVCDLSTFKQVYCWFMCGVEYGSDKGLSSQLDKIFTGTIQVEVPS